ncbi:MAG: hypothetical protein K0U47_05320 [Epsilonproteobacteria bacterium]|nr:hypothetical protein [Campylobacterota bacterium]
MRNILLLSLLSSVLYSAETSAFGAGGLDNSNPYGLTESEKVIFENKKQLRNQNQKIDDLSEQIEGMRSVVDSISTKLGKTGQRINALDQQKNATSDDELAMIKSDITELKRVQNENYEKIDNVLKKLSTMIDKINSNYVTHEELTVRDTKKKLSSSKTESKLTNAQKLKKAVAMYRKKYYTKSFPFFESLVKKGYKPATSNYYLGEISYYKKRYSDAIVYYKKSVGHYDKATYMPTLLLHTGISFEKLDDTENKVKFLEALLSSYPQSSEAKIARKHLN